jgi:hypothetical protein
MSMPKGSTPKDSSMRMPSESTPKDSSGPGGYGGWEGEGGMDGGVAYDPLTHFVQAKDWNCDIETRLKK